MEYNFRVDENGSERTVILKNDMLIYIEKNAIHDISYKDITNVWLNKPGGLCTPNIYSCTLHFKHDKPLFISSKNWRDDKMEIRQENHYNSFIRVLHMHLREKSSAKYSLGVKPKKYLTKVATIILILALAATVSITFQLNNYLLAIPVLISVFVVTCGLNFCLKNYPSKYTPDHIPLSLLPTQS